MIKLKRLLAAALLLTTIAVNAQFSVKPNEEYDRKEEEHRLSISQDEYMKYLDKQIAQMDVIYNKIKRVYPNIEYIMATHCSDKAFYQLDAKMLDSKQANEWAMTCAAAAVELMRQGRVDRIDDITNQLSKAVGVLNESIRLCATEAENAEYDFYHVHRNQEIYFEKMEGKHPKEIFADMANSTARRALDCYRREQRRLK